MERVATQKPLSETLVTGYMRTAVDANELYMAVDKGINAIVLEYYFINAISLDRCKWWIAGEWEIKQSQGYCDGLTCDSTLIISPPDFQESGQGTVKFNDDEPQNIDMWFNSHSFLVHEHRGYKEVIYTLSHHGPLYECHIDQDDNYRGNIRWRRTHFSLAKAMSCEDQRNFPKKMDPSNHFSGIWNISFLFFVTPPTWNDGKYLHQK